MKAKTVLSYRDQRRQKDLVELTKKGLALPDGAFYVYQIYEFRKTREGGRYPHIFGYVKNVDYALDIKYGVQVPFFVPSDIPHNDLKVSRKAAFKDANGKLRIISINTITLLDCDDNDNTQTSPEPDDSRAPDQGGKSEAGAY